MDNFDNYEEQNSESLYAPDSILSIYNSEIYKIDLLSPEEEMDLFNKARSGDTEATEKLIKANLRLVKAFASKYKGRGVDFLDLIQEGNLGLIKAVEQYDINSGFRFSTFAAFKIRAALTRAVQSQGKSVRRPPSFYRKIEKYKKVRKKLSEELNCEPTIEQIAKCMNEKPEEITLIINMLAPVMSMEEIVFNEEKITLLDVLHIEDDDPVKHAEARSLTEIINESFEKCGLNETEQEILRLRFGFYEGVQYTLETIGNMFDIDRERVRQIEARALRKLRTSNFTHVLASVAEYPKDAENKIKFYKTYYKDPKNKYKK